MTGGGIRRLIMLRKSRNCERQDIGKEGNDPIGVQHWVSPFRWRPGRFSRMKTTDCRSTATVLSFLLCTRKRIFPYKHCTRDRDVLQ